MRIDVDVDALKMNWSVAGSIPHMETEKPFKRDLLGSPAGDTRVPGPILNLPGASTTISIDPRGRVQ